jgi:hypothetical protein
MCETIFRDLFGAKILTHRIIFKRKLGLDKGRM